MRQYFTQLLRCEFSIAINDFFSGFGFVSFVNYVHSERAVNELNGKELDGRLIRVEKARRERGYEKTPGRCKY